jgi:hypothetical protein
MKILTIALATILSLTCSSFACTNSLLKTTAEQPKIEIPKHLDHYLKMELGYSSTGSIEVIGKYVLTAGNKLGNKDDKILHVIQKDLFGTRLWWSCLVNVTQSKIQILYRCQHPNDFGTIVEIEKKES